MLFINPMWDNEAERIGKQRCTRLGYTLHTVSDLIGFIALLLLLGAAAFLGYRGIVGSFHADLLWLLVIPFGLAIVGSICIGSHGWWLTAVGFTMITIHAKRVGWRAVSDAPTNTMTRPNQRGAGKGGVAVLWRPGRACRALPDRER